MTTVETNLDWSAIREALNEESWEDRPLYGNQERRVFIGTVFSLFPSRKYYTPWAHSNLEPCPQCLGTGRPRLRGKRRRRYKKWQRRIERTMLQALRLRQHGATGPVLALCLARRIPIWRRMDQWHSCHHCGGHGSREAYLDELFRVQLDKEAEAHGCYVAEGEGCTTDVFACEYREREHAEA